MCSLSKMFALNPFKKENERIDTAINELRKSPKLDCLKELLEICLSSNKLPKKVS